MTYLYAALPILLVLVLMLFFKRGSHEAGFAGWLAGIAVAVLVFGLNWQVFWVSQVKGLLLALNVLAVLWPALILYNLVDQAGGVRAIAGALQEMIPDPGWLVVVQAWMLTALVENLAGFGLPIAIVAPMLIAMGVNPVGAVAASAIGHSWAVSMSGMALAFRTLADITRMNFVELFPTTAILLGIAVLLTGLAVALVLKQLRYWKRILVLGFAVALTQYLVGLSGMIPLSSFSAAIVGILGGYLLSRINSKDAGKVTPSAQLKGGLLAYGFLFASVMIVSLIRPLNQWLSGVRLSSNFPEVISNTGIITAAGPGYILKPLTHPGTLILLTMLFAIIALPRITGAQTAGVRKALKASFHSGLPASIGATLMIGLSTLMEHTGMTQLIADGLSHSFGSVYPLVSPLVGTIGAFATGSNVNSNILFGPMQKSVAELLKISAVILLAAQTTGGSLGSMIAPAKLAVGGSTNSMKGREGEILRITLPVAVFIVIIIGLAAWIFVR